MNTPSRRQWYDNEMSFCHWRVWKRWFRPNLVAGWDFYGHPGILDDTKPLSFTQNVWWNHHTLSKNFNSSSKEILYVAGRNFLLKKKFLITGRDFLPQKETSCHRKKLPVQEKTSYHSKQICVKEEQAGTCIGCDVTKDY